MGTLEKFAACSDSNTLIVIVNRAHILLKTHHEGSTVAHIALFALRSIRPVFGVCNYRASEHMNARNASVLPGQIFAIGYMVHLGLL